MKKTSRKDPSELEKLGRNIDKLIAVTFGLGVGILVILFVYVLATQFLAAK
jgi:hypothetical protein